MAPFFCLYEINPEQNNQESIYHFGYFSWLVTFQSEQLLLGGCLTSGLDLFINSANNDDSVTCRRSTDARWQIWNAASVHVSFQRSWDSKYFISHSLLSDHVCTPTFPKITNSQSWILKNSLIFFTEQFQLQCKWCFVVLFCAIPYSDQNIQYRWANQCFVLLNKQVTSM